MSVLYLDCQNQGYMYPGSITIKSISRECWIGSKISLKGVQILQRMALLVNFTEIPMKMIFSLNGGSSEPGGGWRGSRELHETPLESDRSVTLKYCQGVPQSIVLSATAKQRYCQDLSKQNY